MHNKSRYMAQPAKIRLLQNCLEDRHFNKVIPGFEALDFSHNPHPEWREFQIFYDLYRKEIHLSADIFGAVSSRFHAKGLVDGLQVRQWITSNPGFDVYLVNPFPQFSYTYFNGMERPKILHEDPQFFGKSQRILNIAKIPLEFDINHRQNSKNFSLCSYWFGTSRFWDRIMADLIHPILRLSRTELGPDLYSFLYDPLPYYGQSTHRAGGLPFLLERATSLYVEAAFSDQAAFYSRTREQILSCCLFPFERDLITHFGDQVEEWDAIGQYDAAAMEYFEHAGRHAAHGWRAYMSRHKVGFDQGDPRPNLPWFRP